MRIAIALSGGVDSTVSALLLKQQGYQLLGIHMQNWDLPSTNDSNGCLESEWKTVQQTCHKLDIQCIRLRFVQSYWINVFEPFIQDVEKGVVSNPDIECNRFIKFGVFMDYCQSQLGISQVAFGHYAALSSDDGIRLKMAVDRLKDQTYFLSQVNRHRFQNVLFPIGTMTKQNVKRMAVENGLQDIARRKESMGICFVNHPNHNGTNKTTQFHEFTNEFVTQRPGDMVTLDGKTVGRHHGLGSYVIGQRASIPGMNERWYVCTKNSKSNSLVVVPSNTHPKLYKRRVRVIKWNWISEAYESFFRRYPTRSLNIRIKYRSRMVDPVEGEMKLMNSSDDSFEIEFSNAQQGLTVGQQLVAYIHDECIGGGRITQVSN